MPEKRKRNQAQWRINEIKYHQYGGVNGVSGVMA
jgi:hypothetical protein